MMETKSIYFIIIAMFFSNYGIGQDKENTVLYPWLAKSGQFGYCDILGKCTIEPRFEIAEPFVNGYAVVSKKGQYGVIDQIGKVIVPFRYASIELLKEGLFILVGLKKEYNSWLRFWNWRILPDFNILSTSNHGPFLTTKVPRAVWTLKSLPDKKVFFRKNRSDEIGGRMHMKDSWSPKHGIPADIKISSVGNILLVQHSLYRLNSGNTLKKIANNVLDLIDSNSVLAFNNKQYFKLDIKGENLSKENYTMVDVLHFNVNSGKRVEVKIRQDKMYPFRTIATDLFKRADGNTYLYPDMNKPFPVFIHDYKRGAEIFTAGEIMEHVIMIASVPDSKYFLVSFVFGEGRKRKTILLDVDGNWNTNIPAYEGLDQMLGSGEMLFTRSAEKGILTRDFQFKPFPFDYHADPVNFSKSMFSGKDVVSGKYGIYNLSNEQWQVTPVYNYIKETVEAGTMIYTVTEVINGVQKEQCGLLDIQSNQRITGPVYDSLNYDCFVRKTENGQQISFYINPVTGKEYRE
jgi:hypothetical protein